MPWPSFSVFPFVMGVLRYALDIDRGEAGEPEDIVLKDRGLQLIGVIWVATFMLGVLGV